MKILYDMWEKLSTKQSVFICFVIFLLFYQLVEGFNFDLRADNWHLDNQQGYQTLSLSLKSHNKIIKEHNNKIKAGRAKAKKKRAEQIEREEKKKEAYLENLALKSAMNKVLKKLKKCNIKIHSWSDSEEVYCYIENKYNIYFICKDVYLDKSAYFNNDKQEVTVFISINGMKSWSTKNKQWESYNKKKFLVSDTYTVDGNDIALKSKEDNYFYKSLYPVSEFKCSYFNLIK